MKERWAWVVGYEGLYEVSDRGRVRSCERTVYVPRKIKETMLKPRRDRYGYDRINLYKTNGKVLPATIHVLVAQAFLGRQPGPGYVVCHKEGRVKGNTVENLYWGTHRNNHDDAIRHGTTTWGKNNPSAKLLDADVRAIRKLRIEQNVSLRKLAQQFGVSKSTVYAIILGKTWNRQHTLLEAEKGVNR